MEHTQGIEVLTRAHAYLAEVVAGVPESAWGAPTPCSEWTVRQVLNHARIDQQAYGLAITGGRPDSDPFHPADAVDGDPAAELDKVLRAVADAYAGLPADTEQAPTPLGPMPVPLAAAAAAMDAAVHAWDIAVATGQGRPLTGELAEGIRPAADRLVDHLRDAYQVFAPARGSRRTTTVPRRCSPSWAATRTGRLRRPDESDAAQSSRSSADTDRSASPSPPRTG